MPRQPLPAKREVGRIACPWETMGTTAKPAGGGGGEAGEAGGASAYDTYKGLLTLAKTHAAASGQAAATKGTCKRCGATGHLTFQCRVLAEAGS